MSDDSSPAPDTIGDALRAVQAHFEGEDDPVFADLCDLVNRAAEEHARTPDRTPQLDMANAEIERLAAALRAERAAWQEASGADSPGELTAAVNAHRARRTAELAARAPADRPEVDAEDLWTDYRTDAEIDARLLKASDRRTFLAGVAAGRRTADASRPGLTEDQARRGWFLAAAWARLAQARGGAMQAFDEDYEKTKLAREWLESIGVDVNADPPVKIPENLRASRGETGPAHPLEWTCPKCGQRAVGLGARQSPELGCERCGHVERPAADLGPGIGGAPIRVRPTAAPDPRATLHAGDPASLADVVAASAREPHADVVLHALHVSGGAAAVEAVAKADVEEGERLLAAHRRVNAIEDPQLRHAARARLSVSYSAERTAIERGARIDGADMVWPDGARYPRCLP